MTHALQTRKHWLKRKKLIPLKESCLKRKPHCLLSGTKTGGQSKTEKLNDLLTNIPTNDFTELNDIIYAGAKLVSEKIEVPLKTTDRNTKPGLELRLESQIKRLWQQARIQKQNIKKFSDKTGKAQHLELKKKSSRRSTKKY